MPVIEVAKRTITLKIVYYGCALGGKTTNLVMLQRMTDPQNTQGMVSIATKNDRTLFFDLLPLDFGQIGGLNVKCKLYTVPGQLHYEVTRRQVLAGADGVVLVIDSSRHESKSNKWAQENMRQNLRASRLDPDEIPTVLQWNKRDLAEARTIVDLNEDLNPGGLPAVEAVAIDGRGVLETFGTILKETVRHCYRQTGRTVSDQAIDETIDRTLSQAAKRYRPDTPVQRQYDHRFDMEAYQDEQAEQGKARQIVDPVSLLGESVKASMALAERLDDFGHVSETGERRKEMMQALGWLVPRLTDPRHNALPEGALAQLLEAAHRKHGSLLLFKRGDEVMDEHQVLPEGGDLLNSVVASGLGSLAYRNSRENEVRVIEDLAVEVFFGNLPPQAEGMGSALIAPMACDGSRFGSVVVYTRISEHGFDEAEREFWTTASQLLAWSLHWRALRRKVVAQTTA